MGGMAVKKSFILILTLVLAAGLGSGFAACGRDEAPTTTASSASTTTTTVAETTTSTAVATTTTTTAALAPEPMRLTFATAFHETTAGGRIVQRFCDYVEEKTEGAVLFDVYFAGVVGSAAEELNMVRSGAVDMVLLRSDSAPDQTPLLNFPAWTPSIGRTAVGYFEKLVYDDPDTAALIQAEAAINNVMYLGCTIHGTGVFVGTEPFAVLSDLADRPFAGSGPLTAFVALGYTVIESQPAEIHDALADGVVEAAYADLDTSMRSRWYEVARHHVFDGLQAVGNPFAINLDTWARLAPEIQAVFGKAAKEMADLSVRLDAVGRIQTTEALEAAEVMIGTLTPEDRDTWFRLLFEAEAATCMKRAERLGLVNDMKVVLSRAAEYAEVKWPQ